MKLRTARLAGLLVLSTALLTACADDTGGGGGAAGNLVGVDYPRSDTDTGLVPPGGHLGRRLGHVPVTTSPCPGSRAGTPGPGARPPPRSPNNPASRARSPPDARCQRE